MSQDRLLFLAAEGLPLATKHDRDVAAMGLQQFFGRLASIELRDRDDEIVFAQRGGVKALQRTAEAIGDGPAELDGTLLELVAFDERLTKGDEIRPLARERARQRDRHHAVIVKTKSRAEAVHGLNADGVPFE